MATCRREKTKATVYVSVLIAAKRRTRVGNERTQSELGRRPLARERQQQAAGGPKQKDGKAHLRRQPPCRPEAPPPILLFAKRNALRCYRTKKAGGGVPTLMTSRRQAGVADEGPAQTHLPGCTRTNRASVATPRAWWTVPPLPIPALDGSLVRSECRRMLIPRTSPIPSTPPTSHGEDTLSTALSRHQQ